MSSILDALRKVEAEKTKKKVDLREIEEVLAEKDLLVPEEGEPVPGARGPKRAVIVVALVAVVGVFGVVGFAVHNALRGAPPREVTEGQAVFPGPRQVSRPAIPPVGEPSSPERPPEAAGLAPEPIAATPAAAEPTSGVPEPPAPAMDVSPKPAAAVAEERTPAPAPAKKPAQRPNLRINILRPPSDRFPTPLAVVNGKRVGVGDFVDGAEVIDIKDEGIVFEFGDDLFLVRF